MTGRRDHIGLFAFGGTIAMTACATGGVAPALSATDLLKAAGVSDPDLTLSAETFAGLGSANLTLAHMKQLLAAIAASGANAFVVTQGTDTLEETSFLFSLLYGGSRPVVFTAAMRHAENDRPDGPGNLRDAIAVARTVGAPSVVVVMNGAVHDPLFVRKNHTSQVDAFESQFGSLGTVEHAQALECRPVSLPTYALPDQDSLPVIAHATAFIEAPVPHLTGAEAGLVIDALGGGHVCERWADHLGEIAGRGLPVLLASRCGAGPVLTDTYGYKGAEIDLIARGLEPTGYMDARRARIALAVILVENQRNWRHHFRELVALSSTPVLN